ncbi:hypothetical protein MCC01951_01160 [Bifidobacteriaceae bacterium MCC01951]|nr:hypothetical protein MCC01951_01160 [Bifidobacteriaceae bacterium MCC01951]GDZ79034.1 hypothetical protein MCC01969_01410 [Bifidobacteriaceae bacterium MCC01969]
MERLRVITDQPTHTSALSTAATTRKTTHLNHSLRLLCMPISLTRVRSERYFALMPALGQVADSGQLAQSGVRA